MCRCEVVERKEGRKCRREFLKHCASNKGALKGALSHTGCLQHDRWPCCKHPVLHTHAQQSLIRLSLSSHRPGTRHAGGLERSCSAPLRSHCARSWRAAGGPAAKRVSSRGPRAGAWPSGWNWRTIALSIGITRGHNIDLCWFWCSRFQFGPFEAPGYPSGPQLRPSRLQRSCCEV